MADIRELDQKTVERIAAGEVVERPASVVKELVENSLDAGASRVEVAVEAGGAEGIRVVDDGAGMTREEVRRAVDEHTTSKITDIGDLEGGVGTLGFRGEALHAIGAVSRLAITTRPHAEKRSDGAGTGARGVELTVEGGEVTGADPAGCPEGTAVEVSDLFYNVPARRKYLKKESTEFAHVNTIVSGYALANPAVAVSLSHDGRETFATPGRGDRRETVMAVYGREVAEAMVPVDGAPEGPLDGVSGLVSHPETSRSTRDYLSTFVNGRYVTTSTARNAVVDAYGAQLGPDRYPFAVLDLAVDPADVDVNVHPRKLEVRWVKAEAVERQIQTAVERALREGGLLRSSAPRGRSAPDQTEIDPASSDNADTSDPPSGSDNADTFDPSSGSDNADTSDPSSGSGNADTFDPSSGSGNADTFDPSSGSGNADTFDPSSGSGNADTSDPSSGSGNADTSDPSSGSDSTDALERATGDTDTGGTDTPERSVAAGGSETQLTLSGDNAHQSTGYDSLPDLRVLGQLHDTYVVAEADDGLVLLDQHAADERINYERLKKRFEGDTTTQALADPVELELTAREAALFDSYRDALARLGFQANRVDDRTVRVTTVPALVAESAGPAVVRDVLEDLVSGESAAEDTVEAVADELVSDMACYPSITGNTPLTDGSVVDLLSALDGCENPWACPHGRPVLIQVDSDEIDDRFERTTGTRLTDHSPDDSSGPRSSVGR